MAFSIRWQLVATTAAALTLAFAACGDEEKKEPEGNNGNGGSRDGGGGGDLGDLFPDGGLDIIADLDDNVAGSACATSTDCGGKNAVCAITVSEKGSCSGACTTDDNCGAGGKCVTVASFAETPLSFCAKTCTNDSQCDPELECRKTVDLRGVFDSVVEFLDGGVEGLDVQETPTICQEKSGSVELANGAVGKACTADNAASVCGGGICETSFLNPGGYCTGNCLEDSDCGNTGGCARDFASATLGLPGSCRLKCDTDSDCRVAEEYTCLTSEALFGPGSYCAYTPTFDGGFGFPTGDAGAGGANTDAGTAAPSGDQ
jgi:hypothetical protein